MFPIGVVLGNDRHVGQGLGRRGRRRPRRRGNSRPAGSRSRCWLFRRSRPYGARTNGLRAALADHRAGLRLYRRLRAAHASALFAGYLALSFAISDLTRSVREFALGRGRAHSRLSPLIPAFAPTIAALGVQTSSSPACRRPTRPCRSAADIFTHDKAQTAHRTRLCDVSRGVHDLILPPNTPPRFARLHVLVRTRNSWARSSRGRRLVRLSAISTKPRPALAPRLWPQAFAALVALAFYKRRFRRHDRPDPGRRRAVIATDDRTVAARSQYRTTRPCRGEPREFSRAATRATGMRFMLRPASTTARLRTRVTGFTALRKGCNPRGR